MKRALKEDTDTRTHEDSDSDPTDKGQIKLNEREPDRDHAELWGVIRKSGNRQGTEYNC